MRLATTLLILLLILLLALAPAGATEAGWALLRNGGHVVLLRHANITGSTEPANFDIDKCATQRNLSERGRQQARKIGALFAARAAPVERVLSSRYCRCLDTARMGFEREPEPFAPLDPPPADQAGKAAQMAAIIGQVRDFSGSGNLVMVTHLEDIQELTGISPREGEAVIVTPKGEDEGEGLRVLGRIAF